MRRYVSLLILGATANLAIAQVSIPGDLFDRLDKMNDTTTLTFYESVNQSLIAESFDLVDPYVKLSYNSQYPRGYNDGPIWKGVGLTAEFHGGITGKKGKFTYSLHPAAYISQNADFSLAPQIVSDVNPLGYQFTVESARLDWVQRYGTDAFVKIHPGQSQLTFKAGKFVSSVGTQNYSVGPSTFNPIILSRQGPGFPHLRLGLNPFDAIIKNIDLGKVELNYLAGILTESDYFDNESNNDRRYFNGVFVAYSPNFLPDLTLGFNRVLYKQTRFFEFEDVLSPLIIFDNGVKNGDTLSPNDTFDQLASLTLDWTFSEVGFRAFAEFAKNDFTSASRFRFTATEPEHSRAYTIGFEKEVQLKKGRLLNILYEHTNLSRNHTFLWRAGPSYYLHQINKQGYTNGGQIVGAGIGPGSNSDHLSLAFEKDGKKVRLLFQRIEANKDYFVVNIQNLGSHDIEYSAGLSYQKQTPKMVFALEGTYSFTYNRYYLRDQSNIYLGASSRFKL